MEVHISVNLQLCRLLQYFLYKICSIYIFIYKKILKKAEQKDFSAKLPAEKGPQTQNINRIETVALQNVISHLQEFK